MKKLWLVLLLVVPLGCQPADSTTPPPSDSNSTSALSAPVGDLADAEVELS